MGKKALVIAMLAAFLGLVCNAGLLAADSPDEVTIYDNSFTKHKKGPVKLSHKKHTTDYGVGCAECHHVYEGSKNTWKEEDPVQKCSECHDAKKKQGETKKLMTAFHKNCKNCHKSVGKGPFKKCDECHGAKK